MRHAPDFFARRCDGSAVVIDVRADDQIEDSDAVKFEMTRRSCARVGWDYQRIGGLDPVLAANLRWLAGYRHPRYAVPACAADLVQVFTSPLALMDGARTGRSGRGAAGLVQPVVAAEAAGRPHHLVARTRVGGLVAGRPAMTVSRPAGLQAGIEIRLGGHVLAVTAVTGTLVQLSNVTGQIAEMPLAAVLGDPSLEVVTRPRAPLPPSGGLEVLPEDLLEQARWWEHHITEVLTGHPPDHRLGEEAKAEYDPAVTTLRQRELAKVAELAAAGRKVPLSTLQRLRLGYERQGLWGLVDGRATRSASVTGRADPRMVEAVQQAIGEETGRSNRHGEQAGAPHPQDP